jgi:hypothetical protein
MAKTTKIDVSACDNELHIIATTPSGTSEVCHITTGSGDPVSYKVVPQSILPAGKYSLTMVGINWGGPSNFKVALTTGGVVQNFASAPNQAVGVVWSVTVPIEV